MVFSSLLVLLPPILPIAVTTSDPDKVKYSIIERNLQHMRFQLLLSVGVTAAIVSYIMYVVVKKGSKIGEKLVIHPELVPEPLPAGRA
eukprot:gene41627-56339_t